MPIQQPAREEENDEEAWQNVKDEEEDVEKPMQQRRRNLQSSPYDERRLTRTYATMGGDDRNERRPLPSQLRRNMVAKLCGKFPNPKTYN